MTNAAASHAGIGRAVFATRLNLSIQAAVMSFWLGAVPCFFLPYILWFNGATDREIDIVRVAAVARYAEPEVRSKWEIRDSSGHYKTIEAVTDEGQRARSLKPAQVRQALNKEWSAVDEFHWYFILSMILPFVGYLVVWLILQRIGERNMEDKRIRGAHEVVSQTELDRMVRLKDGGQYKLAEVTLPASAPMTGILMQGAQGSGKSLVIHDLMQQVFAKKRKCVIYDQSGEFFRAYFRPGKDYFFNPALIGSVPWSIFSELKYVYDADTFAHAFLPPKGGVVHGASAFFEDAARALFSVMLLRLAKYGAIDTRDIAKAIFEMPDDEMEKLIEKSVASSAVGGDSKGQRQGVISSIAIYLNGLKAVQPGNWSIRDFLEADDDARFFILGTDDTRAMFSPLYRLILASAFAMISAKQEIVHEDRYWFFLDEVHTLGDIKLDEHLATLRKFGVSIVSGIQSDSQYWSSMGKDRGDTVMNCFNTVLMLRMNEASMMERAAKRLGKVEMETVSQNQALAVNEMRDGAGVNIQDHEKWLIMPSEIGGLDSCTGFLKLVGSYPAAKVDYRHWLPSKGRWGRAYVEKFAAIQDTPERDPSFVIERNWAAGSVDPLVKISEAVKASSEDETATTQDISTEADKSDSLAVEGQERSPEAQEKTVAVNVPEQNNAASMMINNLLGRE